MGVLSMSGSSKILTVSYGTFSCTLEGFDDPLSTMKFIAEYFRELAADDRYFGAVPPTPDSAALHRIAERESQHRVAATMQENGRVHLIVTDGEDTAEQSRGPRSPAATAPAYSGDLSAGQIETVAARLMRIRAAAKADADVAAPADAPAPQSDNAAIHDKTLAPSTAPFAAGPGDYPLPEDQTADDRADEAPAYVSPATATNAGSAVDAIADWRLSESDGFLADDGEDYDDDEVGDEAADQIDELLSETIKAAMSFHMAVSEDPPKPKPPEAPYLLQTPPRPKFDFSDLSDDNPASATGNGADDDERDEAVPSPLADIRQSALSKLRNARARLIKVRRSRDVPPEVSAGDPVPFGAQGTVANPDHSTDEAEAVTPPAPDADPVRRAPTDPAGDKALTRLLAQTNTEMNVPEQRARWSAIAHLKAAVATTVADRISRGGDDADRTDPAEQPYRDELSRMVKSNDAGPATDRPAPLVLVSEQRIDRKVQPSDEGGDDAAPMVRPRRVSVSNLALSNLQATLEPLEYDFTEEEDQDEDDTGDVSVFFDPHDFSEFAQRLGAYDMGELIQAAGVYAALIECRPHFSPMHLIRQIIGASDLGNFDREEGLRSFGSLLREGKIERVRRGQYVVTDQSDFMIEAKRILG
jgi:hypothetical protein